MSSSNGWQIKRSTFVANFALFLFVCCLLVFILWHFGHMRDKTDALVFRLNHFQLNLDPSTIADIESRKIATLLHSGLVAVNNTGQVFPRLAESWTKQDDRTWVFKLKEGIRFSDGSIVNADAVVKSLHWAMQNSHLYSWSLSSIEHSVNLDGSLDCSGIFKLDNNTVVIREVNPVPWFLESLDSPAGWIVGNPGEAPGEWGIRPGIGPYVINTVKSDFEVELISRNDGALVARTDSILFRVITDDTIAARMYQQGDLDLLQVENPTVLTLLRNSGTNFTEYDFQRFRFVIVSREALRIKGFTEEQIETFILAYSSQVDKERIAKLSNGLSMPLHTAFPPALKSPDYSQKPHLFNEKLLPSRNLTLIAMNDPFSDLIANYLPSHVGEINISHRTVESSLLISALFSGEADLISMLIDATSSAPVFWSAFWTPGSSFSSFGTPFPQFSKYEFIDSQDTMDAAKIVDTRGNWIGILHDKGIVAYSKRLGGWRFTPSGQINFEEVFIKVN